MELTKNRSLLYSLLGLFFFYNGTFAFILLIVFYFAQSESRKADFKYFKGLLNFELSMTLYSYAIVSLYGAALHYVPIVHVPHPLLFGFGAFGWLLQFVIAYNVYLTFNEQSPVYPLAIDIVGLLGQIDARFVKRKKVMSAE